VGPNIDTAISPSGDLSTAQEYFIDCSRIFLHHVIYPLQKNISSSGDISTAHEYFAIR
jgi:hypothetical protein